MNASEFFLNWIGERVFVRHIGVEDGFELWPFRRKFRELERAPFAKADEEDAFAVLRHNALRIYDAVVDVVFQVFGQRLVNDAERLTFVVPDEVLDVLQHKGVGPVVVNQFGQLEEEVALFLVLEAVFFAKAEFLGHTRDAERLAGETGAKNVVRRDGVVRHGINVAVRSLVEVGFVGDLRHLVPVGGEDAFSARAFEGEAEAANAAEEVNEFQW